MSTFAPDTEAKQGPSSVRGQVRDEFRKALPGGARGRAPRRWVALAGRQLAAQRGSRRAGPSRRPTIALDAAFAALRHQGIVGLQDAGYTMSDGWEGRTRGAGSGSASLGGVFFHRQDVERAVEGGGLMLAFGAFADGDDHEPEGLRLAKQICEVLADHDIATEWNGSLKQRIRVLPFDWRKRRWTSAPK